MDTVHQIDYDGVCDPSMPSPSYFGTLFAPFGCFNDPSEEEDTTNETMGGFYNIFASYDDYEQENAVVPNTTVKELVDFMSLDITSVIYRFVLGDNYLNSIVVSRKEKESYSEQVSKIYNYNI